MRLAEDGDATTAMAMMIICMRASAETKEISTESANANANASSRDTHYRIRLPSDGVSMLHITSPCTRGF